MPWTQPPGRRGSWHRTDCISAERIQEELAKLLAAPQPGAYLEPAVLAVVLPELTQKTDRRKAGGGCLPGGQENLPVRWAALLGTLGEADTRRVLKRLRCSNACIEETAVLVRNGRGGVCGSFLLGHESGHSIARPTACGSRVPPQRTVLGETPAHAPERASDIHLRRLFRPIRAVHRGAAGAVRGVAPERPGLRPAAAGTAAGG